MAEVGIIASALQIADIGVRLSLHLYTLGETVASADKSITSISKDVSQTSAVLKELGQTLDKDQTFRICSPTALQTADSIVKECQTIFQEVDQMLVKIFPNIRSAEKEKEKGKGRRARAALMLERLRWPFIQGKIETLTSNMERQKSTLVLMLNVIALAKHEHERTESPTIIAEQRSFIQELAISNREHVRNFEQLTRGPGVVPVTLAVSQNLLPTPKTYEARENSGTSSATVACQIRPSTSAQGSVLERNDGPESLIASKSSSPDHLTWLLQQYRTLESVLLGEVSAPTYEITEDSRSRIKADIIASHAWEVTQVFRRWHPGVPSIGSAESTIPSHIANQQVLEPSTRVPTASVSHHRASGNRYEYDPAETPAGFLYESDSGESASTVEMASPRPSLSEPQGIVPRNEFHDDTSDEDAAEEDAAEEDAFEEAIAEEVLAREDAAMEVVIEEDAAEEEPNPFDDDATDDSMENVADDLLARWTILPELKS